MFIIMPYCNGKCNRDAGRVVCQNEHLEGSDIQEISSLYLVKRFMNNPITKAVVLGGREPFDSWGDLVYFLKVLRENTDEDLVIYTGYYKEEILEKVNYLKNFKNIIIKFGRYIPGSESVYDPVLGINLSSNNQRAEKIS